MPEISVIIPAYNAERTIERTVRSVLASSVSVTVIVVDDGSTDGTADIVRQFPVTLISQNNAGAYNARIAGLKAVTTPYFGFVDADDTVDSTMFEKLLLKAKTENLDVVQCLADVGGATFRSLGEYVRKALLKGIGASYVWDKLYKNQFDYSAFEPAEGLTNFDDLILNWQFFRQVRRMGFVDEPLYHYSNCADSAVHKFRFRKIKDYLICAKIRRKLSAAYGIRPWGLTNIRWMLKNARNLLCFALLGLKR